MKDADGQSAVLATQQHIVEARLSPVQCLELIVDQARRITGADAAAIALRDGGVFSCRARSGVLAPDLGTKVDPQAGISGACLRTGEIQRCDDTESDSRVEPSVCRNQGIRSILAVPVRRADALGILAAFSRWAGAFGEQDVRALSLLAESAEEQLPWDALRVAGVAGTPHAQPGPDTALQTAQFTDQRDTELLPAALAMREEARARRRWRPLKSLVLALAVLAVTSEVVVRRGAHIKQLFRMAKAPFAMPMPGAMPHPTSPAIAKPAATIPRPQTTWRTVPGTTPTLAPAPDGTRSSKNKYGEKGPTASTRPLPDEGPQPATIPNPPSGRIEGPVNLHSLFAGLERILQPQPVNPEVNITSRVPRTGDKIREVGQQSAKHKTTKSQPGSGQILEFRGELQDRMHMGRVVGVVGIRFSIYAQPRGGAPLWQEVQSVEVDQFGHFSAQVGSTSAGGFPEFARGLWLGWLVQGPGEVERRMWLVDTPSGFRGEGAVGQIVDRD